MMVSPGAARVLVASDSATDANQVVRVLEDHFSGLSASTVRERAAGDFAAHKPDVLVLAFDCLEKAKSYYLGLYRLDHSLQQHPHRTVVLCNKDEVQDAFELCKQQYFDDYVLYWPFAHDGLRLPMSVWIAAREMMATDAEIARPAERLARASRPLLMVIDDDEMTCDLFVRALRETAYDVVCVGDSTEALRELQVARPEVIFMDIRLPGLDGLSLTRQLKASPLVAKIPVIMMTGDARRETVTGSIDAGAADFIAKPFTREALLAKLEKLLPR